MISSYPNYYYHNSPLNPCEYPNTNYSGSAAAPCGTPFSVKDILNLSEETPNFGYDNSLQFEDDQCYPMYEQPVSSLPNLSDFFSPPPPHGQCQYGEMYCGELESARSGDQWEEAARVSSTNHGAACVSSTNQPGMTSQHVQQLSHLSPPFQEVSSSDDSKAMIRPNFKLINH